MKAKPQRVRVHVALPKELNDFLERKAEGEGVFKSFVVCRALALFKKVTRDMDTGAQNINISRDYWEALNQEFKDLF